MGDVKHFNQKQVREASFIKPPNIIKTKIGSGGLSEELLDKAEELLQEHAKDFKPLAEIYLDRMKTGINTSIKNIEEKKLASINDEKIIEQILFPCVQLKANGGMFQFQLVTRIADRFVQFMEVVDRLDLETLEIANAFHATIKIVVNSDIKGDGGKQGEALVNELNNACMRYFNKHKDTVDTNKRKNSEVEF